MAQTRDRVLIQLLRSLSRPLRPIPTGLRARVRRLPDIRAVLCDVYGTMLVSGAGPVRPAPGSPGELTLPCLQAGNQGGASPPGEPPGNPTAPGQPLSPAARAFQHALGTELGLALDGRAAARGVAALAGAIRRRHAMARRRGLVWPEVRIEVAWRDALAALRNGGASLPRVSRAALRALAVRYECAVNPVWPMPGLGATLAALRRRGIRLGIVSNAQFYTPLTLAAFPETGWARGLFDPALCVWSCQLGEAKPAPRLLALALRRLARRYRIAPAQTLVIGNDLRNDLLPAARLGCRTALFAGDARSLRRRRERADCRALEPDLVIARWRQLIVSLTGSRPPLNSLV